MVSLKRLLGPAFALGLLASCAFAMDHLTVRQDKRTTSVDGRIILTAQDGGILFLARDGVIWRVTPDQIVKQTTDDAPFRAFPQDQMVKHVLADLPKGFDVYQTAHYMVFHDTSRAYAQWCGSLFERLYGAFRNAWGRQGFAMAEPEFPLVAIVFADKADYVNFSKKDLGDAADAIIGYYNLESNRMLMYDLSGVGVADHQKRNLGSAQISQFLASPAAFGTVSTIVHEATHQIAFNSGLHQRLSDCPLWFSEGIAMYCETPDLGRSKGWAGIGAVNRGRLAQFHEYMAKRPSDSLRTLIADNKRLRDLNQTVDAYAEAWALTYFLLKQHPKQYVAYMKTLSKKQPLVNDDVPARIAEFEKQFGPLEKLDADFVRYMSGRLH